MAPNAWPAYSQLFEIGFPMCGFIKLNISYLRCSLIFCEIFPIFQLKDYHKWRPNWGQCNLVFFFFNFYLFLRVVFNILGFNILNTTFVLLKIFYGHLVISLENEICKWRPNRRPFDVFTILIFLLIKRPHRA